MIENINKRDTAEGRFWSDLVICTSNRMVSSAINDKFD